MFEDTDFVFFGIFRQKVLVMEAPDFLCFCIVRIRFCHTNIKYTNIKIELAGVHNSKPQHVQKSTFVVKITGRPVICNHKSWFQTYKKAPDIWYFYALDFQQII